MIGGARWGGANHLLAAAIESGVIPLSMPHREVFLDRGDDNLELLLSGCAVFPTTAIVIGRSRFGDADGEHLLMVGLDGCFGDFGVVPAILPPMSFSTLQPGAVVAIPTEALARLCDRSELATLMLRHHAKQLRSLTSSLRCMARHNCIQRISRWLLAVRSRSPLKEVHVSHERIGELIGVRREAVTEALIRLRSVGAITCGRSRITVVNEAVLRGISCACANEDAGHLEILPRSSSGQPRVPSNEMRERAAHAAHV